METNYECKPSYFPLEGHTLWIFEGGKVFELHSDPKEWHKRKQGKIILV
jgi:hypothetical protein